MAEKLLDIEIELLITEELLRRERLARKREEQARKEAKQARIKEEQARIKAEQALKEAEQARIKVQEEYDFNRVVHVLSKEYHHTPIAIAGITGFSVEEVEEILDKELL